MSQKVFYRYNQITEQYERVYPTARERFVVFIRQFIWGISGALLVVVIAYSLMDFPREKELKQTNERLKAQMQILNRKADDAIAVMEDIAERDNNFYRIMLQSEALPPSRRYAGLERQRNYNSLDSLSDIALVTNVHNKIDQLNQLVYTQVKSFDYLRDQANNLKDRASHIPAIQPVPEKYLRVMASGYGARLDPIYGTMKFREGMDFSSPIGTPVYATGDAVVKTAGWKSLYGNLIELDHGFNYTTRYAHLSHISVSAGQHVKRGDLIGKVGNTGKSTGPHLHYEVRFRGAPQNPVNYYFYDLTPEQYDEMIRIAENAGHAWTKRQAMADSLNKKYYKIGEVAEILSIPISTLRYWEKEFTTIRPKRNAAGTRFYTPRDIEIIRMIHYLVKEKGLKLDAAQKQINRNRNGVEKRHEVIRRLQGVRKELTLLLTALNQRKV